MTFAADVEPRAPSHRRDYSVITSARGLALLGIFVVVTLVGVLVVERATQVFAILGASTAAAIIAAPVVRGLSRHMPRGLAILVVTLLGMVGIVALFATIAWDLNRQASSLADSLHHAVADLPKDSSAAHAAADLQLDQRIDRVFGSAATRLVLGSSDPVAVAAQVGKVVVVGVLGAFMFVGGPQLAQMLIHLARRTSIRESLHAALDHAVTAAGAYVRRTLVVSIGHGVVAGLVAWAFGLPGAISIGAWVAVASTVPILGSLLAWAPIVALAVVADVPLPLTLVIGVLCIVADRVARARWVHRALHVGVLLAIIGIGAGVTLIGVSGAILGLLLVALLAALFDFDGQLREAVVDLVEDPADRAVADAIDTTPAIEPVSGEPRGEQTYLRLSLSNRTAATIAIAIVAAVAVFEMARGLQSLLVWFAIGGFIAFGVDRPIAAINRKWRVPRAAATVFTLGAFVALVALVVVLAGPSVTHSAATVTHDAPDAVRSMESLPFVGRVLERQGAPDKVQHFLDSLPDRLRGSDVVDRLVKAAGDALTGAFWTITFLLAMLWDGPRLVRAVRDRIPAARRGRAIGFGRAAYTAVSNVVAASAFVAALNGTVVMLLAIALGIPLAPVLGLWSAAWNFIPQIGGFVGALPLVALGFGSGPWQGVVALVVFIIYQTLENHVIQPLIGARVVKVPPLVLMIGVLFFGAVFGFVGALLAGPLLGVGKLVINELRRGREHRIEDRVGRPADGVDHQPNPEPGMSVSSL